MTKTVRLGVLLAGETGIDITPLGADKSQIIKDLDMTQKYWFFGDKMEPGGNDYTLSLALAYRGHRITQVKDWKHTWQLLKES